jgi:hypothetical protein
MQVNRPEQRHCLKGGCHNFGKERVNQSSPTATLTENQVDPAATAISKLENRFESLVGPVIFEHLLQDYVVKRFSAGERISEITDNEIDAMIVSLRPSF